MSETQLGVIETVVSDARAEHEADMGLTPESLIRYLENNGTGRGKLDHLQAWADANPGKNNREFLSWCEDECQAGRLGIGTLTKLGVRICGESYGFREPGESNSDEVNKLRIQVNELKAKLAHAHHLNSLNASSNQVEFTRLRNLEEENKLLHEQIETLKRLSGNQQALDDSPRDELQEQPPAVVKTGAKRGRPPKAKAA